MVHDRQRIAPDTRAGEKLAFVICTEELVRRFGLTQRFGVDSDTPAQRPRRDQVRCLKDVVDGRFRRRILPRKTLYQVALDL